VLRVCRHPPGRSDILLVIEIMCYRCIDRIIEPGKVYFPYFVEEYFGCGDQTNVVRARQHQIVLQSTTTLTRCENCSVGYGDVTPTTASEICVAILIKICGLALFASILGGIIDVVTSSSRRARQHSAVRSKLTEVQRWMADRHLDIKTRQAVLKFYAEDWRAVQDEQTSILHELPTDVAATVIWSMVRADFDQVPLWSELGVIKSSETRRYGDVDASKVNSSPPFAQCLDQIPLLGHRDGDVYTYTLSCFFLFVFFSSSF
jgi:hypothetical protein